MKHFFETKEQYLLFRKIWARAVKSPRAKSYILPSDEWIWDSKHTCRGHVSHMTATIRKKGWITPAHMILYNIIRNKPIDTGFTDVTNPYKIANSEVWYDGGFGNALEQLIIYQNYVKEYLIDPKAFREGYYKFRMEELKKFFEPFGTMIGYTPFAELDIPTYNSLERKKHINAEARAVAYRITNAWRLKPVQKTALLNSSTVIGTGVAA
jgi:hypothetical protein